MAETFQMVAKTFKGLEEVLRDELISLGALNVEMGVRMVSFEGDLEMLYKANLCCRTALRVLKPIVKFTANDTDELYDKVRELDWEEFLGCDSTFAIDSTVCGSTFTHSKFVTYRVKDGIADHFFDKYRKRPSIRLDGADVLLNVHIDDNRVTISLDSSGEPLNRRGYRVEQTAAPINEVLAAGIIMKTGWRGDCNFADPMCGSGTFLIEAALIACNINPGIYRESFAFERWRDFDADLFESLYNDDSEEREFPFKIYGGDIDPEAVTIARKNIKAARMEDCIELVCKPFEEWTDNPEAGVMVTNPPYGERLKSDDITGLFRGFGTTLKRYFAGWHVWMIGHKEEHFAAIGLKPSVKYPLLNGDLECTLREYVLFDGSYSEFKTSGGSVHNADFERGDKNKVHRMRDKEWDTETRRFNKKGFAPKDAASKPRRDDRDSKPFRKERDSKPFRRDDRDERPFRSKDRDSKPFRSKDRDERPFRSKDRDGKPFRKERDGKPRRDPHFTGDLKTVPGRVPSLSADSEVVFSKTHMRSRRKKNDDERQD